jgi:hypothetical protein
MAITLEERFWNKVQRTPDGCWPWLACRDRNGYGIFNFEGHVTTAHRVALILLGCNMTGLEGCHHCDYPPCCRPSHLFSGTPRDNSQDMARKNRWRNQSRITNEDLAAVRALLAAGELSQAAIGDVYGLKQSTISNIKTGKHFGR